MTGQLHAQGNLTLGTQSPPPQFPFNKRLNGSRPAWMFCRRPLVPVGIQTPDRPACSPVTMPTVVPSPPSVVISYPVRCYSPTSNVFWHNLKPTTTKHTHTRVILSTGICKVTHIYRQFGWPFYRVPHRQISEEKYFPHPFPHPRAPKIFFHTPGNPCP